MTIQEYLASLRGKTAAVLGIGVSNTPLIELLCRSGVQVIACDKKSREDLGERAGQLEALGAQLHLGESYLDGLRADVIFRTPGMRPDVPALLAAKERGSGVTLACGTGSCAALVAANLCGLAGREAAIELDGGVLHDRWDDRTGRVLMTGPAAFVFDGEYEA